MAGATRRLDRPQRKRLEHDFRPSTVPEATWRPLLAPRSSHERRNDPFSRRDRRYRRRLNGLLVVLLVLGFVAGLRFEPFGVAVRAVLTWGF